MRNKLAGLLFTLAILMHSVSSFATHIFGGELLYTHITGNTYQVKFTVYGDCAAFALTFNSLYDASPLVYILNGNSFYDSIRLRADTVGIEVSPVCPSQLSSTSCNGGTLPGVRKFVYMDTVVLGGKSANWRFIFTGDMGPNLPGAGRSVNITNIFNPGGMSIIQIEADLNNSIGDNSSPVYSTIPTPFYCVNVAEQYNQGAIDADGDSLAFNLVPAVDGNTGSSVSYLSPFTATSPLATAPGAFVFNGLNGQISFTPNTTQEGLVVCQVSEYRKGVLVGTSEREMTFVVLSNCTGTPPNLNVTSVNGGTVTGSTASQNVFNLCVGTPELSFALSLVNPDGDNTFISNSTLPAGATFTVNNNNTPSPTVNFDWNTSGIATGIYTFYVTVKNNHCPISNTQTIAYTINVTAVPTLSASVIFPTQCTHQAYVQYNLAFGFIPRKLTIYDGSGNAILSYMDSTGVIKDSLPPGNYTAVASSDPLCTTQVAFSVTDSGTVPLNPFTANYCIGDSLQAIDIPPAGPGAVITWYNSKDQQLTAAPVPFTSVTDTFRYYVSERYKVCFSDHVPVTAIIHPLPTITIIHTPPSICLGDTIYLQAAGGSQYTWSPEEDIFTDTFGRIFTRVLTPETITVNAADIYGCKDSASVTFSEIEHCCAFGYPNAFTPNGDGRNDGFRIVTYGNMQDYDLSIFNRFGQMIFQTKDPRQYWDGKFKGVLCDVGTYYYYFTGKCLTGKTEVHKGDVTLIR